MVNKEKMPNAKLEKSLLAVLVAVFGTLTAVVTLLSQPGAEILAICGAVVLVCAVAVVALLQRPVWQAELTEKGILCREMNSGDWKLLDWSPYRRAYELRTSRGDSCLILTIGERTRGELIRAYRRCATTGCCVTDGCLCVAGLATAETMALLRRHGLQVGQEPVRFFMG